MSSGEPRLEVDIRVRTPDTIIARRAMIIAESPEQSDSDVCKFGVQMLGRELAAMLRATEPTQVRNENERG